MLDITQLSRRYAVRRMGDADADDILEFCRQNDQYYRFCGRQPSRDERSVTEYCVITACTSLEYSMLPYASYS